MSRKFDVVILGVSLVVVIGVLVASALEDWPLLSSQPSSAQSAPPDALLPEPTRVCPIPTEAVCWCVSAKEDRVYVQEIARPKLPQWPSPRKDKP